MDHPGGSGGGWAALLAFGPAADPDRRIAGLSLAARAAAVACAAGASDPWVAAPVIAPASLDDLRRVCVTTRLHLGTPLDGGIDVELLCDRYLAAPGELCALVAAGASRLMHRGETIARRVESVDGEIEARDVLDLSSPREAARKILAATGKPGDGIVSRWLNRPVSRRLSGLLLRFEAVRPWHLTVVTALIGVAMIAAFLAGGEGGLLAGVVLFHVASVVDGVDGEIARATFRQSKAGASQDTAVDMITNFLFYVGTTICLTRLHGAWHLIAGGWVVFLGLSGLLIVRWLVAKAGQQGSFNILKHFYLGRFPTGFANCVTRVVVAMTSRDFFALAFALLVLLGGGSSLTFFLAGFATLWIVVILAAAPAIVREARQEPLASPLGIPQPG
jgi:CDP-L-myo-inositol myo-inositolphosphotransferase